MIKVEIDEGSGFCFGVDRAVKLTYDLLADVVEDAIV